MSFVNPTPNSALRSPVGCDKRGFRVGDVVRYDDPHGSWGVLEERCHFDGEYWYVRWYYGQNTHGAPITALSFVKATKLVHADMQTFEAIKNGRAFCSGSGTVPETCPEPAVPSGIESLQDFQSWVTRRWGPHIARDLNGNVAIAALGLGGEAGEVQEHFKKYLRDGKPLNPNNDLKLELGDVLHYWLVLCTVAGFEPLEIMRANVEKLNARTLKGQTR